LGADGGATGSLYCVRCVPLVNRDNLLLQAKLGRIATHRATAEARRSATQARQADALRKWNPADLPKWLDEDFYRREILPRLPKLTVKKIRLAIRLSSLRNAHPTRNIYPSPKTLVATSGTHGYLKRII
jgi:hypothetical protein